VHKQPTAHTEQAEAKTPTIKTKRSCDAHLLQILGRLLTSAGDGGRESDYSLSALHLFLEL
jgi:hypothetical protein